MKVHDLLEARRENWRQLETLCHDVERKGKRRLGAPAVARFASLYRAACADLALADAYQLPPNTVEYLHHLVGRAHNQLYRARRFNLHAWWHELIYDVPRRLFNDNALRLAFVLFWSIFLGSMMLARQSPEYAGDMLGRDMMNTLRDNFSEPMGGRDPQISNVMVGYYINHNTGIGLECFAYGLLAGIGGLFATVFNAAFLGASFGYMSTLPERQNFFNFVTAHGPFELTAIVLSAAAGMRLGFAMIDTRGRSRLESLQAAGRETMPTMGAAMVLFIMAACIEAFISPTALPYIFKAFVAVVSSAALMFYFVVLGQSRGESDAV